MCTLKIVFARVPSRIGLLGGIRISINAVEVARLSSFGGPLGVEVTDSSVDIAFKISSYPPEPLRLEGDASTVWLVEVMIDPSMMFKAESRARAGLQPSMFTSVHQVDSAEEATKRAVASTRRGAGSMRRNLHLAAGLTVVLGGIALLMGNWFLGIVSLVLIVTSIPPLVRRSNPEKVEWVDTSPQRS